jgi:hypothetical protein
MMRRTSGDVKSPTKYVIEAFSSAPHRADAVRPGEPLICTFPQSVAPMVWAILKSPLERFAKLRRAGGAVSECQPKCPQMAEKLR